MEWPADLPPPRPSGEVFASDTAPVVLGRDGKLAALAMVWGFPGFPAKDSKARPRPLINTRSETAASRPTWRESLSRRRCLVPAAGFFEWGGRPKRKFLFGLPGEDSILMAALWRDFEGEGPRFSILTTSANESMAGVHDRMPVLVREGEVDLWLGDGFDAVLDRREVLLSRLGAW
jgi:putative SOS response-associated peptidase YedK